MLVLKSCSEAFCILGNMHSLLKTGGWKCKYLMHTTWVSHVQHMSITCTASSSSIGCGAGDHKVSPCSTIISKCGNLLFLHCSFIIPKQSLYIIKVWSTWSTRSPFANGWNVQSISSSRLFLWHSEDVTKKFQLAVPNQMNQRHSVSHGIEGGVQNMVNALYIQHDSVAWGSKGIYFVFHILGDHPRFTAIE